MLLTFATFANADERYVMVNEVQGGGGIWIFDTKKVEVKYCDVGVYIGHGVNCTKWKDLEDNED